MNEKWSNPSPAGLVALAVACFCFYALQTGKVESSASLLLGTWLLGGFVVQVIVGLIDLKNGNHTGGNTFIYFSAFFMLAGGLGAIIKFICAHNGIPLDTRIDGYAWMALGLVTALWTPAFFRAPLPLTGIVLCLDVAIPFIVLADLKILPHGYIVIPGHALLAAALIAVYYSGAMIINEAFGKKILPIPGPICK